jgi:hypothetical protein
MPTLRRQDRTVGIAGGTYKISLSKSAEAPVLSA